MSTSDWIKLVSIPFFTGAIGWLINWTGLLMLFNPVRFRGVQIPRLQELSTLLPRKLQEIPGVMQGGIGWQGIVPARAAKMGSIAVDKAIAKLGTPAEFYRQLEPDEIARHIVQTFESEVPAIVDRTMRREHPGLWHDLPLRARNAVYARVQEQLPEIVRQITDEIGLYIDQLLDPKLMVIDHFDRNPASYLNNLFRLGLVWFSRETLRDPRRYQVLEAQPDVLEAIGSVCHAKVVRRSIHLTPFGENFCRVALCEDETELELLPAHSSPPD